MAVVEYLGFMSERPRFHMGNEALDRNVVERVRVPIHDARPQQGSLTLDRNGFMVVPHHTSIKNFRDPEEVQRIYRPELERAVLEVTHASKVVIAAQGVVRLAERAPDFGATGTT